MEDKMENCKHENGVQVANFDHGYRGSKNLRSYEVYVCPDCGHLINGATGNEPVVPMTPTEIIQMFVDLRNETIDAVDEIKSQAMVIYEKLEGLPERMPKVK
jgi:hypothetical protein